jgi:hypothetical protein
LARNPDHSRGFSCRVIFRPHQYTYNIKRLTQRQVIRYDSAANPPPGLGVIPLSQKAKDRLAGLYGIDVSVQLKAMGLIPTYAVGSKRNKDVTAAVREYKPRTDIEMRALARLKPRSKIFREKRFRRLVQRYLANIHELGARPRRKKRSRKTQDLRRHIKRVHTCIRRLVDTERSLQSKAGILRLSSFHLVEALQSLNCYLESLEMELLSANATRQQFRHAVSPQNLEILELVTLVRMVTGEPHWETLAILLKGATRDAGMNRRRLFQLYKDRESKRERTLGLFRRARLRVAIGELRLP